jgi:hypothetical protein
MVITYTKANGMALSGPQQKPWRGKFDKARKEVVFAIEGVPMTFWDALAAYHRGERPMTK